MPKCARSKQAAFLRSPLALIAAALAVAAAAAFAQSPATSSAPGRPLIVGNFSETPAGTLPPEWRPQNFPDIKLHTSYEAVPDPIHGQVIRASANASASALMRRVTLDAHDYPTLRWRWKADNLIAGGDVKRKDRDDYATRVYVSFAYDPARVSLLDRARYGVVRLLYGEYPPHAVLNYIWDAKAPVGTLVPNPNTSRVQMFVVESGAARLHDWLSYERNILNDYRRAFGEEPPLISGIAIMTDADNTGESAVAYYGNVELLPPAK